MGGLVFPKGLAPRSQLAPGPSPELRNAWICAALGLVGAAVPCLARFAGAAALVGLVLAAKARRDRERRATLALLLNAAALLAALAWTLLPGRFGL